MSLHNQLPTSIESAALLSSIIYILQIDCRKAVDSYLSYLGFWHLADNGSVNFTIPTHTNLIVCLYLFCLCIILADFLGVKIQSVFVKYMKLFIIVLYQKIDKVSIKAFCLVYKLFFVNLRMYVSIFKI